MTSDSIVRSAGRCLVAGLAALIALSAAAQDAPSQPEPQPQYAPIVPVPLGDRPTATLGVRFLASALPMKAGIERFLPKLKLCAAKISNTFSEQHAAAPHAGTSQTAV